MKLKLILVLMLCLVAVTAYAGEPILIAKTNPYVAGAGQAAAGCTAGSGDSAIFDHTSSTVGVSQYLAGSTKFGQQFTIASTTRITRYAIYTQDLGETGSLSVSIYTDSSNTLGSLVDAATTASKSNADIGQTYGVIYIDLPTPYNLSAGTYWVRTIATGGGSFYIKSAAKSNGGIYSYVEGDYNYLANYVISVALWGCAP